MRQLTQNNLRLLKLNEGFRGRPYKDTVGKWTIGYGRNLTDNPLTEDEAAYLSVPYFQEAQKLLQDHYVWATLLDDVRYAALLDLIYNLGPGKFSKFLKFLHAMEIGDYEEAAAQLERSLWWRQVGTRGPRIANMIVTGQWPW